MRDNKKFFYPICGYHRGWCSKEDKCDVINKITDVFEISECKFFLLLHPITTEYYFTFERSLEEQKKK